MGMVGLYGVSAGALGVAAGLSVWQTVLTSLLIFSGGSQFALYGVLGAGGGALAGSYVRWIIVGRRRDAEA